MTHPPFSRHPIRNAWLPCVVVAVVRAGALARADEQVARPAPSRPAAVNEGVFDLPPPTGDAASPRIAADTTPVTSGDVGGTVTVDRGTAPPPIYVPDPTDMNAYAAIPQALPSDFAPHWPRWFAGATGLVMTRTLPGGTATMQPVAGLSTLSTASAGATWPGGIDLHVGRWLGEQQRQGLEGIYWGVYGLGTSATVTGAGIDAIPQAPGVVLAGSPASVFLADASAQQVARADLVNDVEINWLYRVTDRPEFPPRDTRLGFIWLAGFRFFELEDVLTQSSTSSTLAPSPAGANRSLLTVATNNDLWGAQVGLKADWRIASRVRLTTIPKMMIGGNSITNTTTLSTASGIPATFASGAPVDVHSTLAVFSWLGSVDAGVAWDVTERWTLWAGYRVVGVGNIAQADGQWPSTLDAPAALGVMSAGSETVLHGGYAGFQGRW